MFTGRCDFSLFALRWNAFSISFLPWARGTLLVVLFCQALPPASPLPDSLSSQFQEKSQMRLCSRSASWHQHFYGFRGSIFGLIVWAELRKTFRKQTKHDKTRTLFQKPSMYNYIIVLNLYLHHKIVTLPCARWKRL